MAFFAWNSQKYLGVMPYFTIRLNGYAIVCHVIPLFVLRKIVMPFVFVMQCNVEFKVSATNILAFS